MNKPRAALALADGTVYPGFSFGAEGVAQGEVVFNTSMMGYQEILTDPSYCGQIVCMTYPLIGNYGIIPPQSESDAIQVAGFIVKEPSPIPSHHEAEKDLDYWLKQSGVVGLCGIDTRALVRKLRVSGVMAGVISTRAQDPKELVMQARALPNMAGQDLAMKVTLPTVQAWREQPAAKQFRVVAYDYGIKHNILRLLTAHSCQVQVVPASTTAQEVLAAKPDGVFLSNGPGDPAAVTYAVENIRNLIGKVPIFGICLGHQLLGLAVGGKTFKLKFGHRGGNQPVIDTATGKVDITSQNHGFCVDPETLPGKVRVSHVNLNDQTLEGMDCPADRWFAVQYHPEASPGPHDAQPLFEKFMKLMKGER